MAIAYKHPATGEPVERERWRWIVQYNDGTRLEQFEVKDGKATFRPFSDIDQEQVKIFSLVHDTYRPVKMYPPKGAKLLHCYVNGQYNVPLDDGEHTSVIKERGYKLGYFIDKHFSGVLIDHDDTIRILHNPDVLLAEGVYT